MKPRRSTPGYSYCGTTVARRDDAAFDAPALQTRRTYAKHAGRLECTRWLIACLALAGLPLTAFAHAFGERYDLPAPLTYFMAGGAAVVALSFVAAALFARAHPGHAAAHSFVISAGALLPALRVVARIIGLTLFVIAIIAGLYGSRSPEANITPTLVWLIWWIGLSLTVACVGNLWPAFDPWRTLFDLAEALARRCGRSDGIALHWRYPAALGVWPAAFLLLLFSWFEVIYLKASIPSHIATVALCWSAFTLGGMLLFGREQWQRNADVFAVYFATLGRFAPVALEAGSDREIALRPWGRALTGAAAPPAGTVAFVIAMLSTVLFDGLLGGQLWSVTQRALNARFPHWADDGGYFTGSIGLIATWLLFLAAYLLICAITRHFAGGRSPRTIARLFVLTLVPIAVAYLVAHNFANLLIQGQLMIPLASNPLGWKWDLFGSAGFEPDIGIIDARITWYVAISSIVIGHVISVWLAHRVALREYGTPRRAVIASIPLTLLMIVYTAISLSVIAEPLVQFKGAEGVEVSAPSP